jgi:vacuolar-type H+-ATPase subunit I/STV1
MEVSKSHLLLKRVINIKVVVTPRWKEDMQQQLQSQINQFDSQVQKIEIQGQQAEAEIQKQSLNPADPMVVQQINNIRVQVNQKKSELLEKKNQILQQLQQIQLLEMEREVNYGQIEGFFRIETGDNLFRKLQVEILLRDGVVEEIRGDL